MERATFDTEYLRRLAEGDPATERHFAEYFSELLHLALRGRGRTADRRAEIRQETFARVLAAVREQKIERPECLGAYVLSVARHIERELIRQEARFDDTGGSPPDRADSRPEPDRELISRERMAQVEAVLASLSETDRTILRMVFLEEADKTEVCRRLQVGPDYVRVVLHRARIRFRERLARSQDLRGRWNETKVTPASPF